MGTYKDTLMLVDKVTKPLADINKKMEEMDKKTDKVRTRFQKFNDSINSVADKSRKALNVVGTLTKSFIGLVGASGAITMGINKAAEYGDRIDKMSQKIGMSAKSFQEWDYIMSQNGGSVENLQMGFKTLTNQISMAGKGSKESVAMFKRLGVSIKDNNGNLRKQDDVFNDTITALQKMGETTERDAIGQKLLGRSFIEMKPLLNQTVESVDELRKKANKMGLIMSEEDIKNARNFKDTMDTLGRFFQARMNVAVTKIMPNLVKFFEKLMEYRQPIDAILKALGKVVDVTFKFIGFMAKHWEILVGIGAALAVIAAPAMWAAIVAGIGSVVGAITSGALVANLALAGIPIIVGAIVTGITMLITHWDKVKEVAFKVGQAIARVWGALVNKFQVWISKIIGWLNPLLDKLGLLAYFIPGLSAIKLGKDIAGAVSNRINNNSVRQTQNNNSVTNNTTNNNYYGGGGLGGLTPLTSGIYAVP